MTYALVLIFALLAIALCVALVREHRLRRALEALLKRIITAWRSQHADTESSGRPENVRADDRHDDRLQ
jgi:hypothetical protein